MLVHAEDHSVSLRAQYRAVSLLSLFKQNNRYLLVKAHQPIFSRFTLRRIAISVIGKRDIQLLRQTKSKIFQKKVVDQSS